MVEILEQAHVYVTLVLVGLIWTIQLVHYPAFHYVDEEAFVDFEKMHTFNISIIVVPLMLVELGTSATLMTLHSFSIKESLAFLMVVGVWLSTFFLSVPCHKKLAQGKDPDTIRKLVRTNWIRTVLWSLKAILICVSL